VAETPTPEEMVPEAFQRDYDERQKELNRKILDKVAEDPDFRAHLLEDPRGALEKAGLGAEARALDNIDVEDSDSEVEGHWLWRSKHFWRYGNLYHWR
jgi:hypothetical protein